MKYFIQLLSLLLLGALCGGYPSLKAQNFIIQSAPQYCVSGSGGITIRFIAQNPPSFGLGNEFILELSDPNGNFTNPIRVGQTNSLNSPILAVFPNMPPPSGAYRLRVRSTDPQIIGTASAPFWLFDKTQLTVVAQSEQGAAPCLDTKVTLFAEPSINGPVYQYQWIGPNNFSSTLAAPSIEPFTANNAGNYRVTVLLAGTECFAVSPLLPLTPRPAPSAPIAESINRCGGGLIAFTAQMGEIAGNRMQLYTQANSVTPIASQNSAPYVFSANVGATTTFWLEAVQTQNQCVSPRTPVSVNIERPITPFIVVSPSSFICASSSVTLTGSTGAPSNAYLWQVDGATPESLFGQGPHSISWQTSGVKTIRLKINSAICPTQEATQVVTVQNAPGVSDFSLPQNACQGSNILLRAPQEFGGRYIWECDNCVSETQLLGAGPFNISWLTPGAKKVALRYQSGGCPEKKIQKTILIQSRPLADFNIEGGLCAGEEVWVTFAGEAESNARYTWQWSGALAVPGTGKGPHRVVFPSLQNYQLSLTVEQNGCSHTQSFPYIPLPPLEANLIVSRNVVCQNDTITVAAQTPPGARLLWNCDGCQQIVLSPNGGPHILSWGGSGVKTITLWLQNEDLCSRILERIVTVLPKPSAEIRVESQPTSFQTCTGRATQISLNNLVLPAAPVLFNWSCDGCLPALQNLEPARVSWSSAGIKTITLEMSGPNGCKSERINQIVTVNAEPDIEIISIPARNCPGQNTTLRATVHNNAPYFNPVWNCNGCSSASFTGLGPFFVSWSSPGIKSVSLQVSSPSCGIKTTTQAVIIQTPPVKPEIADANRCEPGLVLFTAPGNLNEITIYDENNLYLGKFTGLPPSFEIPLIQLGEKRFKALAYDKATGCFSDTQSFKATVFPLPAPPEVAPVSRCGIGPITLTALRQRNGNTVVQWYPSPEPLATALSAGDSLILDLPYAGDIYARVVNTAAECSSQAVRAIFQNHPFPTGRITAPQQSICTEEGVEYTFEGNFDPDATFLWECDNCRMLTSANGKNLTRISVAWQAPGVQTLRLGVKNPTGCRSLFRLEQTVFLAPNAAFSLPTSEICLGASVTLQVAAPTPGALYSWNCDGCNLVFPQGPGPHTVQWNGPGVKTILLTATTPACGTLLKTETVTVNPLPTARLVSPLVGSVCRRQNLRIEAENRPNQSYIWQCNGCTPSPLPNTAGPINVHYPNSGSFELQLTVTTPGCPPQRITQNILVYPTPNSPRVAQEKIWRCGAGNVTIAPLENASTIQALELYTSATGGIPLQTQTTPPFLFTVPVTSPTTFYLASVGKEGNCASESRTSIVVLPTDTLSKPQVKSVARCGAGRVTFTVFTPEPLGAEIRLWEAGRIVAQSPTGQGIARTLVSPPISASSTFIVEHIDPVGGCRAETVVEGVITNRLPLALAQDTTVCGGGNFPITVSTGNQVDNLIRLFTVPFGGSPLAEVNLPGNTRLVTPFISQTTTFFIENSSHSAGCTASARTPFIITVAPKPSISFSLATNPCPGGTLNLSLNILQGPAERFLWIGPNSFETITEAPNLTLRNFTDLLPGHFNAYAIAGGCTSNLARSQALSLQAPPPVPMIRYLNNCAGEACCVCIDDSIRLSIANTYEFRSGTRFLWEGPNNFRQITALPRLTLSANENSAGFYTVTALSNCSTLSAPFEVCVKPRPSIPIVNGAGVYCGLQNVPISLNVSAPEPETEYRWNGPCAQNLRGESVALPLQNRCNGVYSVQAFQSNGCRSAVAAFAVQVVDLPPIVALQSFPENVCQGSPFELRFPSFANATYQWQTPSGSFSQNESVLRFANASPAEAGIYRVRAFTAGCTTEVAQLNLNILPAPVITFINAPATACAREIVTLQAAATGPVQNWLWLGPEGFQAVTPSVNLVAETYLSGTYTVIATANNGCADTARANIAVNSAKGNFSARLLSNPELCSGESLRFSATVTNGEGNIRYQWQGPNNFTSTVASPILNFVGVENSGIYSVEARNEQNCIIGGAVFSINVKAVPPTPTIIVAPFACEASEIKMRVASPDPGSVYYWEGPNQWRASGLEASIPTETTPWGTYSLRASNSAGCASPEARITLSPNASLPSPRLRVLSSTTLCEGERLELEGFSNLPQVRYQWRGPGNTNLALNPNLIIENAKPGASGVYSLQIFSGLCASPLVMSERIEVKPAPAPPTVQGRGLVCEGDLLVLAVANPIDTYTYFWETPSGALSEGRQVSFIAAPLTTGLYRTFAQAPNNCRSEAASFSVTLVATPLPIEITAARTQVCQGESLLLEATSIGGASLQWLTPKGSVVEDNYVFIPSVDATDGGLYRVRVAALGCQSEQSIAITVNARPQPPIVGYNGLPCPEKSIQLFAQGRPEQTYFWQSENWSSVESSPFVTLKPAGNTFQVVAIEKGCSSSFSSFTIPIEPAGLQVTSSTGAFCALDSIRLHFSATGLGPWYANIDINGAAQRLFLPQANYTLSLPITTPTPVVIVQSVEDSRACQYALNQRVNIARQNPPLVEWVARNCGELAALRVGNIPAGAQWEISYIENGNAKTMSGFGEGIYPVMTFGVGTLLQLQNIRAQTAERVCLQPLQGNFIIGQTPVAEILNVEQEICIGQPVAVRLRLEGKGPWLIRMTNGNTIETRTLGNASIEGPWETTFEFTPTFGVSGYRLTEVIDGTGCRPTLKGEMHVRFRQPQAAFLNRNVTACAGAPFFIPLEIKGKGPWLLHYLVNNERLSLTIPAGVYPENIYSWNYIALENQELELISVQDLDNCPGQITQANSKLSIAVLPGPAIEPQIVGASVLCPKANLTLRVLPVAGATSYIWQGPGGFSASGESVSRTILSAAEAGVYSVTIVAPGCTSRTATRTVSLLPLPTAAVFPANQEICPGESAQVEVRLLEGQLPWRFTYRLGEGTVQSSDVLNQRSVTLNLVPGQSGLFRVLEVVELAGCAAQPGRIAESFIQVGGARCCPAPTVRSIEPMARIEKALLRWNPALNAACYAVEVWNGAERLSATLVPAGNDSLFLPLPPAGINYAVRLQTNCSLCSFSQGNASNFSVFVNYGRPQNRNAQVSSVPLRAYPNPTTGYLKVELPEVAHSRYRLHNLQGELLLSGVWEENEGAELNLTDFAQGFYLLEVTQGDWRRQIKILKQ